MNAGRELDALIAEKVFGWRHITGASARGVGWIPDGTLTNWWVSPVGGDAYYIEGDRPPPFGRYSTDIEAAYTVHDFMKNLPDDDERGDEYHRMLWRLDFLTMKSAEAAELICIAALRAFGVYVK